MRNQTAFSSALISPESWGLARKRMLLEGRNNILNSKLHSFRKVALETSTESIYFQDFFRMDAPLVNSNLLSTLICMHDTRSLEIIQSSQLLRLAAKQSLANTRRQHFQNTTKPLKMQEVKFLFFKKLRSALCNK